MSEHRVAVRYAKSILTLAQEQGVLDEVYQDMEAFEQLCDDNPKLIAVLRNPIVYSYKKLAILKGLLEGKVNSLTIKFFEIIAKKNREEVLYAIAKEFEYQYEQYKNIQRATITTTFPLTDTLRQQVNQMLTTETGKQIKLEEKIDAKLIGGFVLRFSDKQVDTSIKGKLNQLRHELV
ncbi:MAG: ATP synthase F1 subunit delta [Thermonemataceae bacterium]